MNLITWSPLNKLARSVEFSEWFSHHGIWFKYNCHYTMLSKSVNNGSTTIVTCNANYTPWNLLLYPCVYWLYRTILALSTPESYGHQPNPFKWNNFEDVRNKEKKTRFIWVSMFLGRKLLIKDTIFTFPTRDGTSFLCGHPSHTTV